MLILAYILRQKHFANNEQKRHINNEIFRLNIFNKYLSAVTLASNVPKNGVVTICPDRQKVYRGKPMCISNLGNIFNQIETTDY